MAAEWKTVAPSEWKEWKPEPYKAVGHVFNGRISKHRPWPHYCSRCGLVYLKNELTAKAMRLGCHYDDHPSWRTR